VRHTIWLSAMRCCAPAPIRLLACGGVDGLAFVLGFLAAGDCGGGGTAAVVPL
jgi:hypothetical protein